MSSVNNSSRRRRKNRGSSKPKSKNDEQLKTFVNQSMIASGALNQIVESDYIQKPVNMQIVQKPPKNFRSAIYWSENQQTVDFTITVAVNNENNIAFFANATNVPSGFLTSFDVYCIYAVAVTLEVVVPSTSTAQFFGDIYTAIDYDNVNNIGAVGSLQAYSTCSTHSLQIGRPVTRFIKPCVSPALFVSGTSSGYSSARSWVDGAYPNVPHYGLRTIIPNPPTTFTLRAILNYVIGFRNTI